MPCWQCGDLRFAASSSSPASLLDLHLSLRCHRRVDNAHSIEFQGRNYQISATLRKSVTLVGHPNRPFWVLELPPKAIWPSILARFTL